MPIRTTRVAISALLLAGSTFMPAGDAFAASRGTRWGADYFPNVRLTTHDGKVVRFYDDLLKDKIVAVDLIYTHCQFSCPLETARLAQVQRMLGDRVGKDIFFYSITLDPTRDTPEVLKAYARKFGAGPGWLFLTGDAADIKAISKKLGLASDRPVPNGDGHTPDLMIGNVATGQWMRNSAVDNPRMLATTMERFLDGWKRRDTGKDYAQAPGLSFSKGQYLFSTRCAACHTIGRGDRVGPDLANVTRVRDRAWLARYITAPDRLLDEGDPIARALYEKYGEVTMPNLRLPKEDVDALIEFLAVQGAASGVTSAPAAAP
ncbi:MAG: SCO family protein [Myxococcales bacterium]